MPRRGRPRKDIGIEDIEGERFRAQQSFVSEREKQLNETHYWITFHRMGEQDQVRDVFIGAAGVSYNIRKGERVPLPESAINALKLAVRQGLDHGHPIDINGKKYLRKIQESEYSYTIDGQCSPEEAAEWKAGVKRAADKDSDIVQIGGPPDADLVEVGVA